MKAEETRAEKKEVIARRTASESGRSDTGKDQSVKSLRTNFKKRTSS